MECPWTCIGTTWSWPTRRSETAATGGNCCLAQSWAEKALQEIGGETEVETGAADEIRIWLCPMCGSKFKQEQVSVLKSRKTTTCEYCGTTDG